MPVFLLFLVFPMLMWAQYTYKGKVVDVKTNRPIDYVNIGIIGKSLGTVSSDDGSFELQFTQTDLSSTDSILFSRIGYESLKLATADFVEQIKKNDTLRLRESTTELNEVVVVDKLLRRNNMGYHSLSKETYAYWKNLSGGGEHASRITLKGKPQKLQTLSFNIAKNLADSIRIRVNVYDIKNGLPGRNLVKRNIYHTIKSKSGIELIHLSPFQILVEDDFVVSLEFLKVYGENTDVNISAYHDGKGIKSYKRLTSQDSNRACNCQKHHAKA